MGGLARIGVALLLVGCAADLPEECSSPTEGDLEGYCIAGENDGAAAGRADAEACLEDDDEPSVPEQVAEGPGSCGDEVSESVLTAEQAAYEDCWAEAYDQAQAELTEDLCL